MYKYHSAIKKYDHPYKEMDHFVLDDGSIGFCADFSDLGNRKNLYSDCDVFYCEPPWSVGYKVFHELANKKPIKTYKEFMLSLEKFIKDMGRPSVIIHGKFNILKPDFKEEVTFSFHSEKKSSAKCTVNYYWMQSIGAKSNDEVLHYLAEHYNVVGDPVCGYGRTASVFMEHGKRFVCSDINKGCIGVMYDELMEQKTGGMP